MTALGPTAHDKGPGDSTQLTQRRSRFVDQLFEHQGKHRISVVLPARNEAATIGSIIGNVLEGPAGSAIDELVVLDDQSTDGTAEIAAKAGATVHSTASILPDFGPTRGKGSALWRSLAVTSGDIVTWCDADITNFDERFIAGPVATLLANPDATLAKAHYRRPAGPDGVGGGRVTELLARPLLATLRPELVSIRQPLAGEFAGRRDALEAVPFWSGYAVDLGLLFELADRFGPETIRSVDLGERHHRNRSLAELGPQATEILQMALTRAGVTPQNPAVWPSGEGAEQVGVTSYPPMASIREAQRPKSG